MIGWGRTPFTSPLRKKEGCEGIFRGVGFREGVEQMSEDVDWPNKVAWKGVAGGFTKEEEGGGLRWRWRKVIFWGGLLDLKYQNVTMGRGAV